MKVKTCTRCGESYPVGEFYKQTRSPDGLNAWCKECYRDWHRKRYAPTTGATDEPRTCEWCGETYRPKQRRPSVYCSKQCKDRAKNAARQQVLVESKPRRRCVHCAGEMPQTMRIDAGFCSEECNSAAHAVTRKMAKRARQQRFDVGDGLVSRAEIATRDNWRCGICGGRVSQRREHPDPLAPSIDHLIPLARGGGNDVGNLQLVHLRCNLRKRAG